MVKLFSYVLWLVQLACLVIILVSCWHLLDREVFALVAASLTLAGTLYMEHTLPSQGGD